MGYGESRSQTESGIKHIYQYFVLYFILRISIVLISTGLFLTKQNLSIFSNSTVSFVGSILFVSIFILILLIRGLADIFNGRREFDETHESNVIFGSILIMIYFIIFVINLVYSRGLFGGSSILSAISTGFSSSAIVPFVVVLTISMISQVLFGLALMYIVQGLTTQEQKNRLKKAFYLLILGPITLDITCLISLVIFFRVYRDVYFFLHEGQIKAKINAPCPNCNNDISIKLLQCPYCGTKFEKDASYEVDSRLTLELPKDFAEVPKGYAPIEGPTEYEKMRLKKIIIAIIVLLVLIAVLYLVISAFLGPHSNGSTISTDAFIGAWSGGMNNGTTFFSQENWTFFSNGSLLVVDSISETWDTYSLDDRGLCKKDPLIGSTFCYTYQFSNENKRLILLLDDFPMYEFNKI